LTYPKRVNDELLRIHSPALYERPGCPFWRKYWHYHTPAPNETLTQIVNNPKFYDKCDRPGAFASLLDWLKEKHGMKNVNPNSPLRPQLKRAGGSALLIRPPVRQIEDYAGRVNEYGRNENADG
jgi:hypothetical protein